MQARIISLEDYLTVHAVIELIDYLVSGDKDLLVLNDFEGVRIITPATFVELFDL